MTEIDDKILKQFLNENKQEIADDGFTRRVMESLPDRKIKIAQIISAVLLFTIFILFFAFNGVQIALDVSKEIFVSVVETGATYFNMKTLLIISGVTIFWGSRMIYTIE